MYVNIPIEKAQKIVVRAQLLNDDKAENKDSDSIYRVIDQLGYIQIDTIAVVERAHHHTLWTRQNHYKPEFLDLLQYKKRKIFEYWGHAMSYLPMKDYRYFIPRMENFKNPSHKWIELRREDTKHLFTEILRRIKEEGPLSAKDFYQQNGKKAGTWWNWKPAKMALEILFWEGELMITRRKNFHKIYDLRERVLPEEINTDRPDNAEVAEFLVRRAIRSMGIATLNEIHRYLQPDAARDSDWLAVSRDNITKKVTELVENGDLIEVQIDTIPNSIYYSEKKDIENEEIPSKVAEKVFLFSPFDNLIIQRDRILKLFGFDYRLECYVPSVKRIYGYFTLPVFWKNNFVGRIDPKADRKSNQLIIKSLVFEPDFQPDELFLECFTKSLVQFAKFNQCTHLEIHSSNCKSYVKKIMSVVQSALQ